MNSLRGKIDAVRSLCLTYHPDVFAIQETKLGPGIDSGELTIPNYRLYRKDRNTNGGGVAIFALETLNPRPLHSVGIPLN